MIFYGASGVALTWPGELSRELSKGPAAPSPDALRSLPNSTLRRGIASVAGLLFLGSRDVCVSVFH